MSAPYRSRENLSLENKCGLYGPTNFHKKIGGAHVGQKCKKGSCMGHLFFAIWDCRIQAKSSRIYSRHNIYYFNVKVHLFIVYTL